MNDILLKGVTKRFGDKTVLNDFSCTIRSGAVTCVSGASGCGKTTLLNIIAGLIPPDAGTVSGVPQKLAFVFQEDRLCEDFSAVSNVRLVCDKKTSRSDIAACLTQLRLPVDRKAVRTFSGGMKRRVAIARALCYDAPVILMDEPFKGLDDELKRTVMSVVKRRAEGRTLVIVTHDKTEAEFFGGDLLIMGANE